MLLYTDKYRGYGKSKPPQWGSLSSIRASVFRQAASLGIDPEAFVLYAPKWEGAGETVHNLANPSMHGAITTATWTNKGLEFGGDATADKVTFGSSIADTCTQQISLISWTNLNGTDDAPLIDKWFDGYVRQFYLRMLLGRLSFGFANINGSAKIEVGGLDGAFGYTANTDTSLAATFDGNIATGYGAGDSIYTSGSLASGLGLNNDSLRLGEDYNATDNVDGVIHQTLILSQCLTDSQIALLHDSPYYLLEPTPTPIIFDFGAANVPQLSEPANGSPSVEQPIDFSWSAVEGATKYNLQISKVSDFATTEHDSEITGSAPMIVTSKAPGFGKSKPQQWGPLSAVQYAVSHNAEQLGIDPSLITLCLPFWEGAGIPAPIVNKYASAPTIVGSPEWVGGKYYLPAGASFDATLTKQFIPENIVDAFSSPLTLISNFKQLAAPSSSGRPIVRAYAVNSTIRYWGFSGSTVAADRFFGVAHRVADVPAYTTFDSLNQAIITSRATDDHQTWVDGQSVAESSTSSVLDLNYDYRGFVAGDSTNNGLFLDLSIILNAGIDSSVASRFYESPYYLLEPTTPKVYSFGSPATTKQVTGLDAGTLHYWRVGVE